MSANDLEAVQQYSIHRLYPMTRKLYPSTSNGGSLAAVAAAQHNGSSGNNVQHHQNSTSHQAGGQHTAVNIKFATINHHGSGGSMSHSHSTGDVASIFGRAWPTGGSFFGTLGAVASRKRRDHGGGGGETSNGATVKEWLCGLRRSCVDCGRALVDVDWIAEMMMISIAKHINRKLMRSRAPQKCVEL